MTEYTKNNYMDVDLLMVNYIFDHRIKTKMQTNTYVSIKGLN